QFDLGWSTRLSQWLEIPPRPPPRWTPSRFGFPSPRIVSRGAACYGPSLRRNDYWIVAECRGGTRKLGLHQHGECQILVGHSGRGLCPVHGLSRVRGLCTPDPLFVREARG